MKRNSKQEVIEIISNSPEISTEMIVFKAEKRKFEDQFEKKRRVKATIFRASNDNLIKKISINPAKWIMSE